MGWLSRETAEKSFFGRDFMTVCDWVDIRHIPRVQAESPVSRFRYRFQHLPELHSTCSEVTHTFADLRGPPPIGSHASTPIATPPGALPQLRAHMSTNPTGSRAPVATSA